MSPALLDLPDSVLEDVVLSAEHLRDVANLAQTCSALRSLIYEPSDTRLWRALYRQRYESPLPMAALLRKEGELVNWQAMLQERRRVISAIARSNDLQDDERLLETELRHLIEALHNTARPGPGPSRIVQMVQDAALAQPVLTFSGRPDLSSYSHYSDSQPLCQLSTYFGTGRPQMTEQHRRAARARVYMLSHWAKNEWSPFLADGHPDWSRVEALALVACQNAQDLCETANRPLRPPPCRLEMARPFTQPGWDQNEVANDWAGVTGCWRRTINFLDWHVLFAFQRALSRGQLTSPAEFFSHFESPEAVHIQVWRHSITKVVPNLRQPDYPDLHWSGEMLDKGVYEHPPGLRGRVSMTEYGDVKWESITRFEEVDSYCSSGIQVGGIRSGFGVVALWSGIAHEAGDPAGPAYMWKVDEELDDLGTVSSN